VDNRGSEDDQSVSGLCQSVVNLMRMADEDIVLEMFNDDAEIATGAMYARAFVMDLVELHDDGLAFVRTAHEALSEAVNVTDDENS
jgi:hypothetical protein